MDNLDVRACDADDAARYERRHGRGDLDVALAMECAREDCAWAAFDRDEPVAIALAHRSEDELLVGRVHVDRGFRGGGIGRRLFAAALGAGDGEPRLVSVAAGDAAALALLTHAGLRVQSSVVELRGALPREDALLRMAAGEYRFDVARLDVREHGRFIDALDRSVRGTARPSDHLRFAREAAALAFSLNGEFVAYAYARPDGRIGPLAVASPAYATQLFSFALATLQRTFGASWCSLLVPAENLRLLRTALEAGLRVEAHTILAGDAPLPEPERYAGFHPLIF
ncbi:MAG TPA: GNAT family N-acetyltransferase [Candidatus Tumulicola sp.]|jgi:GNAT superfamily N-acetyltransferase